MHIKEIILEGFKTYQSRTVISDLDSHFNAITGENGSGKSNILDSIQFLLGSNSKEMLRFKSSIHELIYKEGHAGIQQASVTISFDIKDRKSRPIGFEDQQKLSVTRQVSRDTQKYYINGHVAKIGKVKQMFRSVQLNIQNPHFLIKQGQITQLTKMKPSEVMGMIQQTAGTSFYNKTKQESQLLIRRKDQKLKQINDILKSTIQPHLAKIRNDRQIYQAWKTGQYTLQILRKRIKLFDYFSSLKRINDIQSNLQKNHLQIQEREFRAGRAQETLSDIESRLKEMDEQRSRFGEIADNLSALQCQSKQNQISKLKSRIQKKQAELNQKKDGLSQISKDIKTALMKINFQKSELEAVQLQLAAYTKNASSGRDAHDVKRAQQAHNNKKIQQIYQQLNIMKNKLQFQRKELGSKKAQQQNYEQELKANRRQLQQLIYQIENLQSSRPQKPQHVHGLDQIIKQQRRINQQLQSLYSKNIKLKLNYRDPCPGFDRSKVYGKLMMLFSVKDKAHLKAIEIGAAAKLNNLVVNDQHTSAALLESRAFNYAISILPQKKISYTPLSESLVNNAKKIAASLKGFAQVALNLIDCDPRAKNSIGSAFSRWMVCSNQQVARRIAFNSQASMRVRCVTLQGEIIDPAGTMTGGYRSSNQFLLLYCEDIRSLLQNLGDVQRNKNGIQSKNNQNAKRHQAYSKYQKELMSLKSRKDGLEERLKLSAPNKKEIALLQAQINTQEELIEKVELNLRERKQLQRNQDAQSHLNSKRMKLRQDLIFREKKIQDLEAQKVKFDSVIISQEKQIKKLLNTLHSSDEELTLLRAKQEEDQLKRQTAISQLQSFQHKHQKLKGKKQDLIKTIAGIKSQLKDIQSFKSKGKQEMEGLRKVCSKILQGAGFKDEIDQLNQKEVSIIQGMSIQQERKKQAQLSRQQDIISKKVNHSTEATEDKLQKQFQQLIDKRKILQKDKRMLFDNMHDLDIKRKQTLQKCFFEVKANLSVIFSDLLPGAAAKLILVDPHDVTLGCQLVVELNGIQKTLGQLSGGQRSLLALSYLLSLLLYKPAPFYILDEIDSALDLSHTENIGQMIRNRFPQSQFILISLKEGMFQNARVLYRIYFQQGQSKVQRQVQKKSK